MKRYKASGPNHAWNKIRFGVNVRLSLYRKIMSFLRNGVPVHDLLKNLESQYAKHKKNDIRVTVLNDLAQAISAGASLSSALSRWAPANEVMIIKAGEQSDLATAFENAATTTEKMKRMKSTIVGASGYPIALISLLGILIYLFSTQAVPKLADVKDPITWEGASEALYTTSKFVENYWMLVLSSIIGLVTLMFIMMPRFTGKIRDYLDKVPPFSVYKTMQSSSFLISMSSLMKTGVPIVDAVKQLHGLSNPYMKHHMSEILRKMNAGVSQGKALNSNFLDKETGISLEIYAELADLQGSMEEIGKDAIDNALENITTAMALLKNVIMLGVGVYIGWVYYAFYTLTRAIGTSPQVGF